MKNNDSKLNQYYIGLPFGNTTYKITVTMLCSDNENGGYKDVGNQTITYVTVYEGNLKLFINGIDYNLIKYFKTGWTDTTMDALTTDPDNNNFNHENIRGWNDIKNIGLTESGLSLYPIEFTGDNINIITEVPSFTLIGYDKDNDLYEFIMKDTHLLSLIETGKNFAKYQKETDHFKSSKGEPYDWFEIIKSGDTAPCYRYWVSLQKDGEIKS
jgi:hypothetical protein